MVGQRRKGEKGRQIRKEVNWEKRGFGMEHGGTWVGGIWRCRNNKFFSPSILVPASDLSRSFIAIDLLG